MNDNLMLSPTDIIAGFEQRIAEVIWTNQRLKIESDEWRSKYRAEVKKFENRPFRELSEIPSEVLIKEINRRFNYYDNYKDRDDDD